MIKKLLLTVLCLVVVLALGVYLSLGHPDPPARQVFINGKILTMDADNRIASAVAVERERIVAVGDEQDVAAYREGAEVIDLNGQVMIPGIIDAHGHFPTSGLREVTVDLNSPPIGNIHTIADMQSALAASVANLDAGEWVVGLGYDDTLVAEKRHPTREDLDAISTEHPIFLLHVSGHLGVANSLGLELAEIDASTPDPEGGVIVRDPISGQATGLLEEKAAIGVQLIAMSSAVGLRGAVKVVNSAIEEYASQGVTTAQSGALPEPILKVLAMAGKWGLIPFRLELWPLYQMAGPDILSGKLDLNDYNSERVRTRTIKIISDGSIQGFTGYLSNPYHTAFRGDEEYRGYPIYPREQLADIVTNLHQAGHQMAIHANGDAAIDDVIHAFEQAQAAHPVADPRLILIHSQMARDDQLDAMKRLGITPSFFSAHTYYWGDRHRDIFMGPERAMRMSPTRSASDRELTYTVHMDSPVVPMEPMLMLWSTVNRLSTSGQIIGEEQRVPVMEALRAITINAAWQIFQEDKLGSIEPGKLADFAILNGDPLGDAATIRDIEVQRTIVGGVTIYQR